MKKMYFGAKKTRSPVWKLMLPVLLFLAVVMLVMAGIQNISGAAEEERLSIMKQAVVRSVVQCYAIEGRYPEDIAYLEEHYGLVLDREMCIRDRGAFGPVYAPAFGRGTADCYPSFRCRI